MTGYYLLDHPNPNGTANPDGRYHGHMVMRENPRLITLHTGEVFADELGDDLGAENIANYFTHSTVAASYHTTGDSDSVVPLLPSGLCERPVHVAFHCYGRNTGNLGYAFGMRAVDWATVGSAWRAKALSNGADVVAAWCRRWDIPVRKITLEQADAGMAGISGHGILQPEDRSDPGAATVFAPSLFPWDEFFELVLERLNGAAPAAGQEPEMRVCRTKAGNLVVITGDTFKVVPKDMEWEVTNAALIELAAVGAIPGENGAPALPTIGDNALATGFLREVPW